MKRHWVRWVLFVLAWAVAVPLADGIQALLRGDPFAALRPEQVPARERRVAVRMEDVLVRHFDGARETGRARARVVTVSRNRQDVDCYDVTEGRFSTDEETHFDFVAAAAFWRPATGLLSAEGARVVNADLDVRAGRLLLNQRAKRLDVPSKIEGRFFDGTIEATSLAYTSSERSYAVSSPVWHGTPRQEEADRRRWTFKADRVTKGATDQEIWTKAEATDGEVIVRADRIERNVKTDVIVATGNVRYFGARENLLCAKVTVYRPERRAVFEGSVNLFIKAEGQEKLEPVELQPLQPIVPDEVAATRPPPPVTDQERELDDELRRAGGRRKYPTTVVAERIEYWYRKGSRRAVLTGSPHATQDLPGGRWRRFWAHRVNYDVEKEVLEAFARPEQRDVRVRTSLGDDLTAKWFKASTREGDDAWEAQDIQGVVVPDDEEVPRDDRQPPPALRGRIGGQ